MPFARNNLECVVGSADIERIWSRVELDALIAQWKQLNWLDSRGNSTGEQVIVGGFSHIRVERIWTTNLQQPSRWVSGNVSTMRAQHHGDFRCSDQLAQWE